MIDETSSADSRPHSEATTNLMIFSSFFYRQLNPHELMHRIRKALIRAPPVAMCGVPIVALGFTPCLDKTDDLFTRHLKPLTLR